MIKKNIAKALNEQMVKEFYSAYLYLAMASYFEGKSLAGFAKWMRTQAQEELSHAMIFFNYICEQGAPAACAPIPGTPADFKSAKDVFLRVVEHERKVTASINKIVDLAIKERDHATKHFLDWFVNEQVEEEASAGQMLDQVKRVGDGNALYIMDKEAGARVFTLPPPLAGKV